MDGAGAAGARSGWNDASLYRRGSDRGAAGHPPPERQRTMGRGRGRQLVAGRTGTAFGERAIFGTAFNTPPIAALGLPSYPLLFAASVPAPGRSTAKQSTTTEELQFQGRTTNDFLLWQAGGYLEFSAPLDIVGSQSPVVLSCTNSTLL